jgi:hypothetical protein
MKKTILIISMIIGSMGLTFAENVISDIGSLRKWKAVKVSDHLAWGQEGCVAYTLGDTSRLEVYAERERTGEDFTEPTVQVVSESGFPKFFRATLKIDNRSDMSFELSLANLDQNNATQVALATLDDREDIISLLERKNSAHVTFFDKDNRSVKKVVYSLSGSQKTIGSHLFPACDLKFTDLSKI